MKLSVQCTNRRCSFQASVEASRIDGTLPNCVLCGSPVQVRSASGQLVRADTVSNASVESLELVEAISSRASPLPQVPGYAILAEIGRGGMGVVYRAQHEQTGQIVALKMILFASLADQKQLGRFLREIRAMASLCHPQILRIVDAGEWTSEPGRQRLPFLCLEYCEGGSLAELLDRRPNGRLDPRLATRLMIRVARAVEHAHQQRIVHRDLKPENILLRQMVSNLDELPEQVRVADFGLAKSLAESVDLTGSNGVIGTPAYMAPEQAAGLSRQAGPEVDIYALGVILYRLLTGTLPFRQANVAVLLATIVSQPPKPLRAIVPSVPRALERICLRCLEKKPTSRYASAGQLADELEAFLRAESPAPAASASRADAINGWKAATITLSVVLVCLLVGLVAWLASRDGRLALGGGGHADVAAQRPEPDGSDQPTTTEPTAASPPTTKQLDPEELLKRQRAVTMQLLRAQAMAVTDRQAALAFLDDPSVFPVAERDWSWIICRQVVSGLVWDEWQAHRSRTKQVLFVDEAGTKLVSTSTDGTLCLWDVPQRKVIGKIDFNPFIVNGMVRLADGTLAVGLEGGSIRLIDPVKVQDLAGWHAHRQEVYAIAASADGLRLASVGADRLLRLWDVPKRQPLAQIVMTKEGADKLALDPQMRFAAIPGGSGKLCFYELSETPSIRELSVGMRLIRLIVLDQTGHRVAIADNNSLIEVYDTPTAKLLSRCLGHRDMVAGLHLNPDDQLMISVSHDRTLRCWHLPTGEERVRLPTDLLAQSLAVSAQQLTLAIGDVTGKIKVCRLDQPPGSSRHR
jgi:serine/threonine protein kinase